MSTTSQAGAGPRPYLTPGKAASALHVSAKTIDRWANGGRVPCLITPGGHRRFRPEDIDALIEEMTARGAARSA
ncbi:MAG: helix-turn-helix domain-containing protein [Actinomycetota bacterium]|nr:helix-turn-helix domain-containing protein [Actinomycetota bacterium]